MRWSLELLTSIALLAAPAGVAPAWAQPSTSPPNFAGATSIASVDGDVHLVWSPQSAVGRVYVLDPGHSRIIGFGGEDQTTQIRTREVWAVSLAGGGWSKLLAGNPGDVGPTNRTGHTMTYDSKRGRVILFGGSDPSGLLNDVWALSLSGSVHWTLLAPTGTPPAPRDYASAIYDPVRDRIVYFAGHDGTPAGGIYSNEIWQLSLASNPPAWTLVSAQGPYPTIRKQQFAGYDAANDRMLMYGNDTDGQVWELDFAPVPAWHVIPSSTASPTPTNSPQMVFDAARNRLLLMRDKVWEFPLGADPHWALLASPAPPAPANIANSVIDPAGDRVVRATGPGAQQWSLADPPAWVPLPGVPDKPLEREGQATSLDPQDRMWIFGGVSAVLGTAMNDVWRLDLQDPPAWSAVTTTGTPPAPRAYSVLQFDQAGNRLIVFGGLGYPPSGITPYGDLWQLSLSGTPTWAPLVATGSPPPPRSSAAWILDPIKNRLLIFGGSDGSQSMDGLWELNLSSDPPVWTQLTLPCPCPNPIDYQQPSAVYDPIRRRVVLYFSYLSYPDAMWELDLEPGYHWTPFATTGAHPVIDSPALMYDFQRDRIVLHAFVDQYFSLGPLGSPSPTWGTLHPTGPSVRYIADRTFLFDVGGDRLVTFAPDNTANTSELWTVNFGSPLAVPPVARPTSVVLESCRPNPAVDGATIAYSLPAAARVRLEVFDVTGRRLAVLADGFVSAGRHDVHWGLRTDSGSRIGPGVYLYRLHTADATLVHRMVALK